MTKKPIEFCAVPPLELGGARLLPGVLDLSGQQAVLKEVREIVAAAPLRRMETPGGRRMSVQMTAAGEFGWVSDRSGYRYASARDDGAPWPAIPPGIRSVWDHVVPDARAPECCLVNFYDPEARMGLHRDADEADFSQPVVSISLGDEGRFRIGGESRGGRTESAWLRSGDVLVLEGAARLAYHGIDRIRAGTSTLLTRPGRVNLTMRVVT